MGAILLVRGIDSRRTEKEGRGGNTRNKRRMRKRKKRFLQNGVLRKGTRETSLDTDPPAKRAKLLTAGHKIPTVRSRNKEGGIDRGERRKKIISCYGTLGWTRGSAQNQREQKALMNRHVASSRSQGERG